MKACVIAIDHGFVTLVDRFESRADAETEARRLNGDGPPFFGVTWLTEDVLARLDRGEILRT